MTLLCLVVPTCCQPCITHLVSEETEFLSLSKTTYMVIFIVFKPSNCQIVEKGGVCLGLNILWMICLSGSSENIESYDSQYTCSFSYLCMSHGASSHGDSNPYHSVNSYSFIKDHITPCDTF